MDEGRARVYAARMNEEIDRYQGRLTEAVMAQAAARWREGQLCGVPWPPSLDDVQHLPCELPAGHDGPHWGRTPWSAQHSLEW